MNEADSGREPAQERTAERVAQLTGTAVEVTRKVPTPVAEPPSFGYLVPVLVVLFIAPYLLPDYHTILLTYGLVMAVAALGFNLLLGYTGLLSFGHAAFFGVGAYTVAFLVRDFGIRSMEIYLVAGLATSFLLAALLSLVVVRYTRIFFAILMLGLAQVLWSLVLKFYWVTGGTDGLRVPTATLLGGLGEGAPRVMFLTQIYYYYVLVFFIAAAALMWLIVNSPLGRSLQAIRDNEVRADFIGIRVRHFRWIAFVISGTFTGLAGVLYAPLHGLANPEIMHWTFSGEIVFMTLLGGFRSFAGPVLGAVVFNFLKPWVIATTVYWQFVLGAVLVLLTLAMPTGLMGILQRLTDLVRRQG